RPARGPRLRAGGRWLPGSARGQRVGRAPGLAAHRRRQQRGVPMSGPSTRPGESGAAPTEPATGDRQVVVIRAADAETLAGPTIQVRLLADSSATGGALSTQ